ncbi:MAG: hypothetical protein ACRD1U_01180 [Vicinamibacterales bacterium]
MLARTWAPAFVILMLASATRYALEKAAPDARSIGGVIRSL